jgi:hypothetical protein
MTVLRSSGPDAQLLPDAREILLQPLVRHFRADRFGIGAGGGDIQVALLEVRGKDLSARVTLFVLLHALVGEHRDRIGLFTGGAARDPHTHRDSPARFCWRRCPPAPLRRASKDSGIAEEARHADQRLAAQRVSSSVGSSRMRLRYADSDDVQCRRAMRRSTRRATVDFLYRSKGIPVRRLQFVEHIPELDVLREVPSSSSSRGRVTPSLCCEVVNHGLRQLIGGSPVPDRRNPWRWRCWACRRTARFRGSAPGPGHRRH